MVAAILRFRKRPMAAMRSTHVFDKHFDSRKQVVTMIKGHTDGVYDSIGAEIR